MDKERRKKHRLDRFHRDPLLSKDRSDVTRNNGRIAESSVFYGSEPRLLRNIVTKQPLATQQ
jgi:hypothetical protein